MEKNQTSEEIELPNKERIRTFGKKENYKNLGILKVDPIKQAGDKRKYDKRVSQTNDKTSRNQALLQKSHQTDKHMDSPSCKMLGTILKMDKGRTQKNEP